MKKMKKYLSMSLAVIMALAMAAPSFAEPGDGDVTPDNPPVSTETTVHNPNTNITINNEGTTSNKYAAYKLLNATNGKNSAGEEIYAYTINDKYAAILKAQLPDGQTNVMEYLKGLEEDGADIRTYADAVYRAIKVANITPDVTTENSSFKDVKQGYYLIADISDISGDDTHSLVMLDTAGRTDTTINVKKEKPQVEKKIVDNGEEVDTSNASVGEDVTYRLKGTLPADYETYKTYSYKFIDDLSKGLDFVSTAETVIIKINGTQLTLPTEGVTVEFTDKQLTVEFADLKKFTQIDKNSTIVVEYIAKLNEKAQIGEPGNDNKVKLEYSNDPYNDGNGDKGTTPDDYVELLTFKLTINKTTEDAATPLSGAGFTLYKEDKDGKMQVVTTLSSVNEAGEIDENLTSFAFERLGEGKYMIEETTVPDGYNKADDITFTIVAKTEQIMGNNNVPMGKITSLEIKDLTGGTVSVTNVPAGELGSTIVNVSGTILPSTGGIGTTIFYAAGIILMAGAVFFVVRRKRA